MHAHKYKKTDMFPPVTSRNCCFSAVVKQMVIFQHEKTQDRRLAVMQSDIVISSHAKFFYILGGKRVFESGFKENNKKQF